MPRIGSQLKKAAIFIHGWMGVGFCLIFLLWFTSGIVLIYCDYPIVSSADQLAHSAPLNPSRIQLSAEQAFARLQFSKPPADIRPISFDGRPAYRFHFGNEVAMVYADNGEIQSGFPPGITLRIASNWAGLPSGSATAEVITDEDQWTVSEEFRALRPICKYTWPAGEEVYVSTVSGQVAQYTTRGSRLGTYSGAIPHWLYFTPLRKRALLWSRVVIWVSGLGIVVAVLGLILGVWMYSPSKAHLHDGEPSRIPYAGQKRWHMILGLLFGPVACLWVFSGMLSMDPFPKLQKGNSDIVASLLAGALRATPSALSAFATKSPRGALQQLGSGFQAKELELTSFRGEPVYLATTAPNQTRIIPVNGEPASEFDRPKIIEALRQAAAPYELAQVRIVSTYEAYYSDRYNRLPLPVIFVELNDRERSSFYVDPATARIVQAYNSHSRGNRWLYHGIHSLDLPGAYNHRPLWNFILLILMLGGTSLCATSLLLAVRLLRRRS
jgi:hypothetical protein